MDFSNTLSLHLSTLIPAGVSFTLSQMEKLLESVPENQQTLQQNTLLRVLAIAHSIANRPETSEFQALELILKGLALKISFSEPVCYLATCNFEGFSECCMYSSNDEIKKVNQQSFGLYPLTYPGLKLSVSMYLQKGKDAVNGNPHWLSARTTLREYYEIKGSKTIERVKEVYLFLLSDKRLLDIWKKDPLKSFWAELYFRYNTCALQPYVQEEDNAEITWQRRTQHQLIQQTKQFQQNLSLDERLLYYLCLAILTNYKEYKLGYNPFQSAFSSFLKAEKDYSPWYYLMALLSFHLIAKKSGMSQVSQQCISRFKVLISNPKSHKDATPFLYFFLNEDELLEFSLANEVEFWRASMPSELKRKIAHVQTLNGIFFKQTLSYIKKQEFLISHVFNTPMLSASHGLTQIMRLERDEQWFIRELMELVEVPQQDLVRNYRSFIEVWKNYHKLLQVNSLELAEQALLDDSCLHRNSQAVFLFPRYDNNAAFNIVLRVAKAFQVKAPNFDSVPILKQKMEFFQNQTYPQISPILTEQQRDSFWKEWIEILKHDKEFVGEIMRADQ